MDVPALPEPARRIHRAFADALPALQAEVCAGLERADGEARFGTERWERPGGGGGTARVLQDGPVLEKAGVNASEVFGEAPAPLAASLPGDGPTFVAAGLSIVVHPRSPFVPTAHANVRFERWRAEAPSMRALLRTTGLTSFTPW